MTHARKAFRTITQTYLSYERPVGRSRPLTALTMQRVAVYASKEVTRLMDATIIVLLPKRMAYEIVVLFGECEVLSSVRGDSAKGSVL